MAKRPPDKIAGIVVFTCPRRPGTLRLTPKTCAASHKMAQSAEDEAKVRLWECIDCQTGAQHLAALGGAKPDKAKKELPDQMQNLLRFVTFRGQATTAQAASHFERHHGPVHTQLVALEGKGLLRRAKRDDGALVWEVAL